MEDTIRISSNKGGGQKMKKTVQEEEEVEWKMLGEERMCSEC